MKATKTKKKTNQKTKQKYEIIRRLKGRWPDCGVLPIKKSSSPDLFGSFAKIEVGRATYFVNPKYLDAEKQKQPGRAGDHVMSSLTYKEIYEVREINQAGKKPRNGAHSFIAIPVADAERNTATPKELRAEADKREASGLEELARLLRSEADYIQSAEYIPPAKERADKIALIGLEREERKRERHREEGEEAVKFNLVLSKDISKAFAKQGLNRIDQFLISGIGESLYKLYKERDKEKEKEEVNQIKIFIDKDDKKYVRMEVPYNQFIRDCLPFHWQDINKRGHFKKEMLGVGKGGGRTYLIQGEGKVLETGRLFHVTSIIRGKEPKNYLQLKGMDGRDPVGKPEKISILMYYPVFKAMIETYAEKLEGTGHTGFIWVPSGLRDYLDLKEHDLGENLATGAFNLAMAILGGHTHKKKTISLKFAAGYLRPGCLRKNGKAPSKRKALEEADKEKVDLRTLEQGGLRIASRENDTWRDSGQAKADLKKVKEAFDLASQDGIYCPTLKISGDGQTIKVTIPKGEHKRQGKLAKGSQREIPFKTEQAS